jgi:hypothetical protein
MLYIYQTIGIVAALLLLATGAVADGFRQAFAYSGKYRDGYYDHHSGADRSTQAAATLVAIMVGRVAQAIQAVRVVQADEPTT